MNAMNRPNRLLVVVAITLAMTACRPAAEPASAFAWPASLVVVGDGRRLPAYRRKRRHRQLAR